MAHVIIITGGYSGLGREAARTFVSAGARVIAPARDVARAKQALDGFGGIEIEPLPLDLLDPVSIDDFAKRFVSSVLPLNALVINAGIMALPERTLDARGYEMQFANQPPWPLPTLGAIVACAETHGRGAGGICIVHGAPLLTRGL